MDTIKDTDGNEICANSWDHAHVEAGTNYQFHFLTAEDMKAGRKVCAPCLGKFRKHNAGVLGGKVEEPVNMSEPKYKNAMDLDDGSFDEDGHRHQTVDFNYAELDGRLDEVTPDARQMAGEVLRQVFTYVFNGCSLRSSAAKLCVIVGGLRPEIVGEKSFLAMAKALGLSKAAISKANRSAQARFGIEFARSRKPDACGRMRAARMKQIDKTSGRTMYRGSKDSHTIPRPL